MSETRLGKMWTVREETLVVEALKDDKSYEEIAVLLNRSVPSIRNRISARHLRRDVPKKQALPVLRRQGNSSTVKEDDADDEALAMFLWFMRQAWQEGVAVTIPSLGATFVKAKKQSDD